MTDVDGATSTFVVSGPVLIVAVKADCDGCRSFYSGDVGALDGIDVIIVAAEVAGVREFASASRRVYAAPDLLAALGVTWPPFFVLVAPAPARVVVEGIAFSPEQVAAEIEGRSP